MPASPSSASSAAPHARGAKLREAAQRLMPWALAVLACIAVISAVARWQVDALMRAGAVEEAANWTRLLHRQAPALGRLSAGRPAVDAGPQLLDQLATSDELVALVLFDADGQLAWSSASLTDARHPGAAGLALQGWSRLTADGRDTGDAPQVLIVRDGDAGMAHLAVVVQGLAPEGRRIGSVAFVLDLTRRADGLEKAFWGVILLTALLFLTLAAAATGRVWRLVAERLKTEERVRYLGTHDALTDTFNRDRFAAEVRLAHEALVQGGAPFALMCLDLDRFKQINDQHGHAAGDAVLRHVGERLRAALGPGDAVGRLGGDEFAVLQRGIRDPMAVEALAHSLLDLLSQPIAHASRLLVLGASIGARHVTDAATPPDALLAQADAALYESKAGGRGRLSWFDDRLAARIEGTRALVADLRRALARGEMRMQYQPVHALDGKTLVGYEALMRWRHPVHGDVPPGRFIALAEQYGLIAALGDFALRRACADAAAWPQPLTVAVNLSPAQIEHGDIHASVRAALDASGLPPWRLEVEITEGLLLAHHGANLEKLSRLHAMGVRVAMDDFGTGYSSMAYLWRFPFHKIKIDRAFVRDLGADAKVERIVRTIVELAHSLGIRVTGEGVETAEQLRQLTAMGCDEVQGYLLGRPGEVDQLPHLGANGMASPAPAADPVAQDA